MANTSYNTTSGFSFVNTLSIDNSTFTRWDKPPTTTNSVSPSPGSTVNIINATKTIDSVHDELGKEAKKAKPNDWEDKVIEYTQIGATPPLLIPESLNTYAKCVVTENAQSVDEGKIPYTIPDNNEFCYIKDCFPGACVPGLNNLLDQSAASLKTFFEQTGSSGFTNPLKGGGGIGQQLFNNNNNNHLQYTAYFNYDLLMFQYIFDLFSPAKNSGSTELNAIYNKITTTPTVLYTPKEIQIINSVNLNYLWAYLMIFCKESVEDDTYLLLKSREQQEYYNMLNQLSQIRFDGFMVNGDGYISNPVFYYRGSKSYYMINNKIASFIDGFCKTIYKDMKGTFKFTQAGNDKLGGGVQYTTSQSMAATCISSIMGKLKSVVCRNADNKDPIKNACMNEITRLMNNKAQAPSGWSILKFSGDSSHVVFGEIMEWIKNKYNKTFQINYLLSERPLAGRLLSAGKTIMMVSTNVFMKNFTGKGSENKNHRRAVFYITFDKSISYINIIEGLYEKINNVRKDNNQYRLALASDLIQSLQTPTTDTDNFSEKAAYLSKGINVQLQSNPTIDNIGDPEMNVLNQVMIQQNIVDFLQAYEVDELTNKLKAIKIDFITLGQNLIGRRLFSFRIGSKSNWKFLISELYDRERNIQHNVDIVNQYDNIRQIMSLSNLLSDKLSKYPSIGPYLNGSFDNLKKDSGFNAIFLKIIKSYSDATVLNKFEDERIAEWLNNKKGESQKIPSSVELIIQDLKQFIVDCLKVNTILGTAKITGGGSQKRSRNEEDDDDGNKRIRTTVDGNADITPQDITEEAIQFVEDFENTLNQSMITYDENAMDMDENDKKIDYSEIQKMVNDFVKSRQDNYYTPDQIKLSMMTIQNNIHIYNVLADRVLLLSGLLDVKDGNFIKDVKEHFTFIIQSYMIAGFPDVTIDTNLLNKIRPSIEIELQTDKISTNLKKLNTKLDTIKPDHPFYTNVEEYYPLLATTLKTERLTLNPISQVNPADSFDNNIINMITYLQNYNEGIAKNQLLQPYKESENSVRTTILDRLLQMSVTLIGKGGKKTKKRRKNSSRSKGHQKPKKRRTIKKNHKY